MKVYTVTLHGWNARNSAEVPWQDRRQMRVVAESMVFSAGHLIFYQEGRITRVCAPGHWAFVVEEGSEAGVASYALAARKEPPDEPEDTGP